MRRALYWSPGDKTYSSFFDFPAGDFILNSDTIIAPTIMPARTERKITIARDASNFQKRKDIVTGRAFCTENIATRDITINKIIRIAINLHPQLFLKFTR
jgi:hypothetical protein